MGVMQWLGPMPQQTVHARCGHKMRFAQRQWRFNHPSQGVKNPDCICAPCAANVRCAWHRGDRFHELWVTDGEILNTVVKAAIGGVARGHATTSAMAFFEHADPLACLHQGSGEGDTGHAGPNDSCVFHVPTLHLCDGL